MCFPANSVLLHLTFGGTFEGAWQGRCIISMPPDAKFVILMSLPWQVCLKRSQSLRMLQRAQTLKPSGETQAGCWVHQESCAFIQCAQKKAWAAFWSCPTTLCPVVFCSKHAPSFTPSISCHWLTPCVESRDQAKHGEWS